MAFIARYAPGLSMTELAAMTPEETAVVRKAIDGHLKDERAVHLEHTKAIMKASGGARFAL